MRDERCLFISSLNPHLSSSPLSHSIRNPETATGIPPAGKGFSVADDITGAAFQTTVMHEGHLLFLFRPGIAAGRTGIGAAAVVAAGADRGIKNDVRVPVDGEAGIVENFVDVHSDLQAVKASERAFFKPTFFFTSRRTSLGMLVLGVPSMR